MKQVKIYDRENKIEHGGIITDDGNIICGCCGGYGENFTLEECFRYVSENGGYSEFDYEP